MNRLFGSFIILLTILSLASSNIKYVAPIEDSTTVLPSRVSEEATLTIRPFHDKNFNTVRDDGEELVDATGHIGFEGGERVWQSGEAVTVTVGVDIFLNGIQPTNELYTCRNARTHIDTTGVYTLYIPCHITWYMLLPYTLNWGMIQFPIILIWG